jgi:hypothetical protein
MKATMRPTIRLGNWMAWILCIICPVCASAFTDQPKDAHFQFAWPVPSRAQVEMDVEEDGELSRLKFSLELTGTQNPDELQLVMSDFEFLQVGDADLDDPLVRAELAPLVAITAAIPPLIISTEGQFLRIDDWDQMIDRVGEFLQQMDSTMDESAFEYFKALLKDPANRKQIQSASARDWLLWVGSWKGVQLDRGESRQFPYLMNMPWGGEVSAEAIVTYLPPDERDPNAHRLRLRTVCTGPGFRQALMSSLEKMLPPDQRTANDIAEMRASIGDCSLEFNAEVTTDPVTLIPALVTYTKITKIGNSEGPGVERIEKKKYTFTWE